MTLGELQCRYPNAGTHTHTYALSHPVPVTIILATVNAGAEPAHHITATTVTTLFCPASISVKRENMDSEKLYQQVFLRQGWWSETSG